MIHIRPAQDSDSDAIAALWHQGWNDGHHGLVPEELYALRTLDSFQSRSRERVGKSSVAIDQASGQLMGFVTTSDDELEQFFLARDARGTGLSKRLMECGENMLREAGNERAWLAVVEGNDRPIRLL